MADREFVFGNPEVQKLLREKFVPLAMNDWYLRRQQDEAGAFFRGVADQGPRKGEGGGTRQGRYAFTASGKLLGFNNNRSVERIVGMLRDSLTKWEALGDADRRPAVSAPSAEPDKRFHRMPPAGGAIIKVHTRVLEAQDGKLQRCAAPEATPETGHKGFGAAIDHLWLRTEEIAALLPKDDQPAPLPPALAQRIARYHLTDSTRGEPPFWDKKDVKEASMTLTRQKDGSVRLAGIIRLETADGSRGFQGKLLGALKCSGGKLVAWDAVVLGDHWGEGPYTRGARPGKTPLGFAFSLVADPKPADRIAPQASHSLDGYWRADQD